jgi:hypothetical protein
MEKWWTGVLSWFCIACFSSVNAQNIFHDSIEGNKDCSASKIHYEGFAATTFFINDNWKGKTNSNLLIAAFVDITRKTNSGIFGRIIELRSDISYQKFIDSVWIKNNDSFFLSSIWTKNFSKDFLESFLLNFKSQFTNTWEYPEFTSDKPKWKSGPMLPFTFISGFGFNGRINQNSYINFSLISLKMVSIPKTETTIINSKTLYETGKVIINYEQGINLQSNYSANIFKNITVETKSSCFLNGTQPKDIKFDMQNLISLKLYSFLKIRFANYLSFDTNITSKIQTKYELLFGCYFDK